MSIGRWLKRMFLFALMVPMAQVAVAEPVYDPEFALIELGTGITMRYAVLGEEGKPVVMMIHGATDSYNSFSQVAPLVAEAGYRVYVPELRGHGGTDKPNDGYYTIDQHAADIDALLSALGVDSVFIVGHSLGSFVAQRVSAREGAGYAVTGVTLIGTGASLVGNETLTWLLYGDGDFPGVVSFVDGVPVEFVEEWAATSNEDPEFGKRTLEHALSLPGYSWVNTFFGLEGLDQTEVLGRIGCPVQVVWGSEDAFFGRDEQIRVIEALGGSGEVDFVTVEGASHNTHWDAGMARRVADAITHFAPN